MCRLDGRELQRWVPDPSEGTALSLDDDMAANGSTSWDQFALNERKFGVRTDYREELYTTVLDPSKSRISRAEANRIASEIEAGNKSASTATTNIHMMEERGMEIDDGDMDEEARYGAVMREPAAPAAKPAAAGSNGAGARPAGAWGRGAPGSRSDAVRIIDPRREANKLRAQMSAGKKSSPYGTPTSPLVSDIKKMEALNLDPGMPRVDAATRREFIQFKQQQAPQQHSQQQAPRQQQRGQQGQGGMRQTSSLSELRQFSEELGSRMPKGGDKAGAAAEADKKAESPASKAPVAAAPAADTSKLSLNPNAKEFTFNISAKEFKPTFAMPAPAVAAAPSASAGGRPAEPPAAAPGPAGPGPASKQPGGFDGRGAGRGPGEGEPHDGAHGRRRDDREERHDRRGDRSGRYHDGMRQQMPLDTVHPPPPPPGKSSGGGPMAMPGMGPSGMHHMMAPVMMMPQGMPQGGPQQYYLNMGPPARPGAPMFLPPPGGPYMGGRPMMMPMMGPGGMAMHPNMMGMNYMAGGMPGYSGPPGPGGQRGGGGRGDHGPDSRGSPHRGSPHRGSPLQ